MDCRTPEAKLTIYLFETGIQKLLDTYRYARPEEFRVVSSGFPEDPDPETHPILLNQKDPPNALEYSIKVVELWVDMYPPKPDPVNPIPPKINEFQAGIKISFDLRDLKDNKRFTFTVTVWINCKFTRVPDDDGKKELLKPEIVNLKMSTIGPDPLRQFLEYVALIVLQYAVKDMRFPTTAGLQDLLQIMLLELGIKDNAVQLYTGVQV
ncbi:MAG TPA: hypothetical protein PLI09_08250 [Candidatus Hydrogenedentes bacterium]|nr:hypothetical protein [Candidatus Hydrogenedentota bacterium]